MNFGGQFNSKKTNIMFVKNSPYSGYDPGDIVTREPSFILKIVSNWMIS